MTHENKQRVTRSVWQDHRALQNFGTTQPEHPHKPAHTLLDDDDLALEALGEAAKNHLRLSGVPKPDADLSLLRLSPNWNVLAGLQEATRLPVPLNDDPYTGHFVIGRTMAVEGHARKVQEQFPAIVSRIRHGIQEGIRLGYTLPTVADRLEDAVKRTPLRVVDEAYFDHDGLAHYLMSNDKIEMSAEVPKEDFDMVLTHELAGHKNAGGTFRQSLGGVPIRTRTGFEDDRGHHSLLDEAVRHHLALSYLNGHFDIMDPDKRPDGNKNYYANRKIVSTFIEQADGLIDLRNITRASDEDTDEEHAELSYRRAMMQESRLAYGPGAYNHLNNLLVAAGKLDSTSKDFQTRLKAMTDRIHPPLVSIQGRLIRGSGFIDLAGL